MHVFQWIPTKYDWKKIVLWSSRRLWSWAFGSCQIVYCKWFVGIFRLWCDVFERIRESAMKNISQVPGDGPCTSVLWDTMKHLIYRYRLIISWLLEEAVRIVSSVFASIHAVTNPWGKSRDIEEGRCNHKRNHRMVKRLLRIV